jgi:hypothetical protein
MVVDPFLGLEAFVTTGSYAPKSSVAAPIVQFAATLEFKVRVPLWLPAAKATGATAMRAKARAMGTSDFFMVFLLF